MLHKLLPSRLALCIPRSSSFRHCSMPVTNSSSHTKLVHPSWLHRSLLCHVLTNSTRAKGLFSAMSETNQTLRGCSAMRQTNSSLLSRTIIAKGIAESSRTTASSSSSSSPSSSLPIHLRTPPRNQEFTPPQTPQFSPPSILCGRWLL